MRLPVHPADRLDFRRHLVARAPLFRGLDAETFGMLAGLAQDRRVARREGFFQQGDSADDIFVLCAGCLKMTRFEPSGEQVVLRFTLPGEAFGALDVEPGGAYPVCATALESSHALAWDRGAFDELGQRNPILFRNVVRILAGRARELEQRCCELTVDRVPSRLARALLRLRCQIGRPAEGGVLIGLSREELAQLTGTTLFTVSRVFGEWQDRRLVCARREAVLVTDADGLAAIAHESPGAAAGRTDFVVGNLTSVKDGTTGRR
jgi:CRP-like cAMP-binding protein